MFLLKKKYTNFIFIYRLYTVFILCILNINSAFSTPDLNANKRPSALYLVASIRWFENRKHCLTVSFSLLKFVSLLLEVLGLSEGIWIKLPARETRIYITNTGHITIPLRAQIYLLVAKICRGTPKFGALPESQQSLLTSLNVKHESHWLP